mgnify:CR=1 FL=1
MRSDSIPSATDTSPISAYTESRKVPGVTVNSDGLLPDEPIGAGERPPR